MLSPFIMSDEELDAIEETDVNELAPAKTYRIDFETGEIYAEFIDGLDAVRQHVIKSIKTFRDTYLIYSEDFGSELNYLIGQSFSEDYLNLEIPRLIQEAIMLDDRIESAENFIIEKAGDELYIAFTVTSVLGDEIPVEVTFNV